MFHITKSKDQADIYLKDKGHEWKIMEPQISESEFKDGKIKILFVINYTFSGNAFACSKCKLERHETNTDVQFSHSNASSLDQSCNEMMVEDTLSG